MTETPIIAEILDKLNLFIKRKGLRRTPQRDEIVTLIFSKDEHFTADELYDRIRKNNSSASRATLYRTLSLLEEAGLLHEIDLGGDQKTYDPNFVDSPSHNHLICIDCGKVVEFEDDNIEILNDCITRRMGFRPAKQSIRIEACCETLRSSGVCKDLIQARLSSKKIHKK
ncbi:MAG: Fur family transcriptional regulator [Akkermansiaceae bacterium]